MDEKSFVEKLTAIRDAFAKTYERYAPEWSGESFDSWLEYPHTPDLPEANHARSAVQHVDSLLWMLEATERAGGHLLSPDQLEDFAEWYATVRGIMDAETPRLRSTIKAGYIATVEHPSRMRAKRIRSAAKRREENKRAAEKAMAWAREHFPTEYADDQKSLLVKKAAEHLGIDRTTLYRRLKAK